MHTTSVSPDRSRSPPLSPDVERAVQCDLAGRHCEAVDHLVAGVRKNDVEAITRLGKRLLVGDRAPHLPKDGAGLLADADSRGGAEAAAVLSVLYALGVSDRHDVKSAVESLTAAAERGFGPAQAQLRVLADADGAGADAPPASTPWREVAKRIDLAYWQTPPPAIDVNEAPLIRSFRSFVPPAVCRWVIDRSRGRLSRARVYEALIRKTTTHHSRTNTASLFNLLDTDLVLTLIQVRMCACLNLPLRRLEPLTVLHYAEGEQITEHFDFIDPNVPDYAEQIAAQGQRIVTFLLYLNDDYADGETEFPRLGIRHRGRRAEGLFFVNAHPDGSSDLRTLHAGRPPRHGEKWIVSQFVRSRPTF